jgi:transcription initiation factor TFIIE subunit alpha
VTRRNSNLKDLYSFIEDYVGPSGKEVFKLLAHSPKEMLDDDIVKKTGLDEQEVRRTLYELHNIGLVTYKKLRNPEDSRYIYYWRVDASRINHVLLQRKKAVLNKLKERLKFEEENTFFKCPVDGVRLTYDEALENDFKCPRCGGELEMDDNTEIKEKLRKIIKELEEEVEREEKLVGSS